jgi:hypothetical protein
MQEGLRTTDNNYQEAMLELKKGLRKVFLYYLGVAKVRPQKKQKEAVRTKTKGIFSQNA